MFADVAFHYEMAIPSALFAFILRKRLHPLHVPLQVTLPNKIPILNLDILILSLDPRFEIKILGGVRLQGDEV